MDHPSVCWFSTAKESNAFYRRNLAAGQKGFPLRLTLPPTVATTPITHACGRRRQSGRRYRHRGRYESSFDQIPLDKMSVSMTMNGAVLQYWRFILSPQKSKALHPINYRHHSKRYPQRVSLPQHLYLPPKPSMRIIADIIAWCSGNIRDLIPSVSAVTIWVKRVPTGAAGSIYAR